VNDELGRIWKDVVFAYLNIPSQHFPRQTEENQKEPQSGKPVFGL
jgi:hypothetical protein